MSPLFWEEVMKLPSFPRFSDRAARLMIKLFIKDDAFHPVRASEGNLLPCLHFYEANLNIICRRIDPVLGDFVYVSTFFGKWTCSAKKKSICISIKCITISYEGCAHHGKVF